MRSRVPSFLIGFVVPIALVLLLFPFWNRVEPFVFGFPFIYFWIFLCMILTSACLYIAFRIDPANEDNDA